MEGKINNTGSLEIKRRKLGFQKTYCPFNPTVPTPECGDWCPLFGEPRNVHYPSSETAPGKDENVTRLTICHGHSFEFNKFTDERK